MRIFSTSSLGWLGCSAAAAAAILSLSTTDADDSTPDDVGRTPDKIPVAFTRDDDSASISPESRGPHGSVSYASYAQPWGGELGQRRSDSSGDHSHGGKRFDLAQDDVLGGADRWYGFSGVEFGNNAVTRSNNQPPAQGQPLSFALQPEPIDSSFFPLNGSGFNFPDFPTGVPNGSGSTTGSSGSGSSSGSSGIFFVSNGGLPFDTNDGGSSVSSIWGWSFGGTAAAPEPSSWALGGIALAAAIYLRRRSIASNQG